MDKLISLAIVFTALWNLWNIRTFSSF